MHITERRKWYIGFGIVVLAIIALLFILHASPWWIVCFLVLIGLVALYDVDFTSSDEISTVQSCVDSFCTSAQIAAYDIIQWKKAIKAKELTGAMADASVCINPVLSTGVSGVDVEVVISWGGRQNIAQNTVNAAIECGSSTENRRVVVVNSFIFIRA